MIWLLVIVLVLMVLAFVAMVAVLLVGLDRFMDALEEAERSHGAGK